MFSEQIGMAKPADEFGGIDGGIDDVVCEPKILSRDVDIVTLFNNKYMDTQIAQGRGDIVVIDSGASRFILGQSWRRRADE